MPSATGWTNTSPRRPRWAAPRPASRASIRPRSREPHPISRRSRVRPPDRGGRTGLTGHRRDPDGPRAASDGLHALASTRVPRRLRTRLLSCSARTPPSHSRPRGSPAGCGPVCFLAAGETTIDRVAVSASNSVFGRLDGLKLASAATDPRVVSPRARFRPRNVLSKPSMRPYLHPVQRALQRDSSVRDPHRTAGGTVPQWGPHPS
jgi:hypothetical protein